MNKNILGYILMLIVMLAVGVVSLNHFFMIRTDSDLLDINHFPMTIDKWQGKSLEITEKEYDILETRNLISRNYFNPETKKNINLFIIYSETNRSVFHPPEVCLMGSGIDIVNKNTARVGTGKHEFSANELFLQKGNNKMLALYCYNAGSLYTENFYLQQASFAINQITGKQRGGATVRVMMRVENSREDTIKTLSLFMADVVEDLGILRASR